MTNANKQSRFQRRVDILEFIADQREATGLAPKLSQVASHFGFSKEYARQVMTELADKGLLLVPRNDRYYSWRQAEVVVDEPTEAPTGE